MIEVLVGNIGSGKSTWTEERAKQGALVVSDDAIVDAVHGGVNSLWSRTHKPLYVAHELVTAVYGVTTGRPVVIDRTSMTRKARKRWVVIGEALETSVVCIVFPMTQPHIHAQRRFDHDPRGHSLEKWNEVATRMHEQYEQPELSEGFDNIVGIDVAKQMLAEGIWGT